MSNEDHPNIETELESIHEDTISHQLVDQESNIDPPNSKPLPQPNRGNSIWICIIVALFIVCLAAIILWIFLK